MKIKIYFNLKQNSLTRKNTQCFINDLSTSLKKYNIKRTGINFFEGDAPKHNWHEVGVVIYLHEEFVDACEELKIKYEDEDFYEDMLEPLKESDDYFRERRKKVLEWEANGCKGYPW